MKGKTFAAGMLAATILAFVAAGGVIAHGDDVEHRDPGYGMGYGMEPDPLGDYCPGCGMTGGYGMGPGMMGGQGMGPGMMGGGRRYGLDLNSEQRKQMARIGTELRKHNWALQGEIIDAQGKLFELYADDKPDAEKIGAVYGKIFDLRRQMIEAAINAQNRQRAVLTNEQREQLRIGPYGGKRHEYGPDPGSMDHEQGRRMMGG